MNATFAAALSSSHYPGETEIRIDSYRAGGLFLALTHASPVGEQAGHLCYDSGIAAPISAALLGLPLCQENQDFKSPALGLTLMAPRTPHFLR